MPRTNLVLQVFVASPSDVAEERAILGTVIDELNRTWSANLGLTFELLRWETHVRPGFDVDPQAVVNAQIPQDYDVFIGLFWSRLGTPTGRATSGSVEEFDRAYARFKSTGSIPELMIYFKDAPIAPSKIDAHQFAELQRFRASLTDKGGLISSFEDHAGFEAAVRTHLSAIAQKFAAQSGLERNLSTALAVAPGTPLNEEEYGIIDFIDIYTTRSEEMTAAMTLINEATERIGQQLAQRAREIPATGMQDTQSAARFVKRASDDMFRYAETLQSQVVLFASARREAFESLSDAIALMPDFPAHLEQLPPLRQTLVATIESARTARTGLSGMRDAANGLPRVSKELNKAKRAVVENLDKYLAEIHSVESTVVNVVDAVDRLLSK